MKHKSPRPILMVHHRHLSQLRVAERIMMHRVVREAELLAFVEGLTAARQILCQDPRLKKILPLTAAGAQLQNILNDETGEMAPLFFEELRNGVARAHPKTFYPYPDPPERSEVVSKPKGTFDT